MASDAFLAARTEHLRAIGRPDLIDALDALDAPPKKVPEQLPSGYANWLHFWHDNPHLEPQEHAA